MMQDYHQYTKLYHSDKSAVAEYSINVGRSIQVRNTRILATRSGCMEWIIREAIEIEFHCNMTTEAFSRSKSCEPLLQNPKERKKAPFSKEKRLTFAFEHPKLLAQVGSSVSSFPG
jgi:hypothetical protein